MISIITPWVDHPELIPDYEQAVKGAQVIIVDNASQPENARLLSEMTGRLNGVYIRNDINQWFSTANNQGLERAAGDVVLFLNNDIKATGNGFLAQVKRDTNPGTLCGPSMGMQVIAQRYLVYIEGWCIAARREVWNGLNGWDADAYPLPYWEDNDLCFRAAQSGIKLVKTNWPIQHLSNTTTKHTEGAYQDSPRNKQTFTERVRAVYG